MVIGILLLSGVLYYGNVVWFALRYWRMVQRLAIPRAEQLPAFWRLAARDTALLAIVPLPLMGLAIWLHL